MKALPKKILLSLAVIFTAVFSYAQNTGIGTTSPNSKLHVASTTVSDSVALKVSVDNATKLKVTSNGGVAIGTVSNPPANGLLVSGIIVPGDSIKNTTDPIYIVSVADSVVLRAGNTTITLTANGAVKIKASGTGGISIDGGSGNVNISGTSVNISSATTLNISSAATTTISSSVLKLGANAAIPVARFGDQITGTASGAAVTGNISGGSSVVLVQ